MSHAEIQALFLRGAEAGAKTLVNLLEAGTKDGSIKPRDLAVVTGIMVDKVVKLAPFVRRDEDPSIDASSVRRPRPRRSSTRRSVGERSRGSRRSEPLWLRSVSRRPRCDRPAARSADRAPAEKPVEPEKVR